MAWPRTTHKTREIASQIERDNNLLAKVENKSQKET